MAATGEVTAVSRKVLPVLWNGYTIGWEFKLQINGFVYGIGPAQVSAAMGAMESLMRIQDVDSGITSSGVPTSHWLPFLGSLDGVRVESFDWVDSPLHLATEAKYAVSLAALYGNANESKDVVELSETLQILGEGGADTPLAPQATEPSIYQEVQSHTDVVVTQSGVVSARSGFPPMPLPVISEDDARQVKQTRNSPSVVQRRTGIEVYRRSYSYTFVLPAHPGAITPNILT